MVEQRRARWSRSLLLVACGLLSLAATLGARADEFIDRVNAAFKGVPADKRSDEVILPLLAKMDRPPAVLKTQARAALLGSKGPGWSECADWAQKPAQHAIIEALDKVTKEDDRLKAYVFAQPYGTDGVSVDMVAAQLYTELGDPPLLAAARHLYMPALESMGILAQVEASRLEDAGDPAGALKVMTDWIFFCRQIADRQFLKEKRWAMESIRLSLERLRDIAFLDFRAEKHALAPTNTRDDANRLRSSKGFLAIDRITLPEGDFVARDQLLARIMIEAGGANEQTFGPTLARVAASDHPLQLFGAAAFWDSVRSGQANTRDTKAALAGIREDYQMRWNLPPFDRVLGTTSYYRRSVAPSSALASLHLGLEDIEDLLLLRRIVRTEAAGTRMALGVYGYLLRQKTLPKTLAALRPDFVGDIDKDPYSRNNLDIQFFVPVRDTPKGPNGEDLPITIQLFPPEPYEKFQIKLGADQFVIYSIGPDEDKGWAAYATQERTGVAGDYLLFPPTLSLFRQRLIETNQLK